MNRIRKSIAIVASAACFGISVFFLSRSDHYSHVLTGTGPESVDTADALSGRNSRGSHHDIRASRDRRNDAKHNVDTELRNSVESMLKTSELKRFKYDRKLETDKRVLYEFLIEAPTGDDLIQVNRNLSRIRGTTSDSNGKPIEWRQLLAEHYSTGSGFRYKVVSVTFPKDSTKPRYTVLGIKDGNLKIKDGGGAFPIDGKMNFLAFDVTFDPNSDWRYAHLFEND